MMFGWIILLSILVLVLRYLNRHYFYFSTKKEKKLYNLRKLFVAGDITIQEYQERKAELIK